MKLVAAKCPSCGANIEVDKKQEITKCKYCKTKIIIDDAITKYKLEVEINNMPTTENYLKLGKRFYYDGEYNDSYKMYSKAVEISPDNSEAVLYQGLSKSLCTNYKDFELDDAFKATKNALNLINKDDKDLNDKYILELTIVTLKLQDFAIDFYNNHALYFDYLEEFFNKLKYCLFVLEFCYDKTYCIKNKIFIINKIIKLINYILKNKKYINDSDDKEIYILDFKYRIELLQKKKEYKEKLYSFNPNLKKEEERDRKKKINLIFTIVIEVIIFFFFIKALTKNTSSVWAIILLMDFILLFPFVSKKIFEDKKIGLIIKSVLFVIGVLGVHLNSYPEFANYTYKSTESDLIIQFKKEKVKLNGITKNYNYIEKDNYIIIGIDNYKFKYRRIKDEYLFCLLDDDECKYYFNSNNKNHKYLNKN